ncbi:MAG TPA: hypothetical protein VK688_08550 [Gemmatimonadales bacterium]|nr:hypothetical protein [Gemmatimonadales bacterium]
MSQERSGRRTISPEDLGLAADKLSPTQRQAWDYIAQHGIKEGWPRPGRPSKAARVAGRPRLKDLGLTKRLVWMMRQYADLPRDVFEARLAAGRRGEGMLDRVRPRRKAERLIDDVRRSVPFFTRDETQRLLDVLADLLERGEEPER